ncbi:putative vacuolar protein sorting-associated protein [Medicago truncatula]|uniref:Putative vacuolar protein sorting-associated protein n=1 Tax=Medicago truncatula TaxID=3880 RepID=A0A396JDE9_MEDTR|nr:putative vacuolar protein sorting-associated protein [Medicago truncatula]
MLSSHSNSKKKRSPLIETSFKLPSDIPVLPPGDGFASGIIDLGGGLLVSQISTFNKVWTTNEGGPDDLGVTIFEPTGLSEGFFVLGYYCQPNNKPLHGWVLVDIRGYIWLPIAPDGYKVVGHVVTTSQEKPSLDKIMCVRSDLTDECVKYKSIKLWRTENKRFNVYDVRPMKRGVEAKGVYVGTFLAQCGRKNSKTLPIVCLKNTNAIKFSSMPNLHQIETLIKAYSPYMYLHPMDKYLPSSVEWFFINGTILCEKRDGVINVSPIEPTGSNLPQGCSSIGMSSYWLDLPMDEAAKERVKKGDLQSSKAYVHVKPMLGGTFTDLVMWVFYPFNGGARAKVAFMNIPLRTKGEHVGDWEHVTLRVSNFSGELWMVYLSQHSKGQWVDACDLEFKNGNRPVLYSSLHGHALFPRPGCVMQGVRGFGIRNDACKSDLVMDMVKGYEIVAAEYLGSEIREPPWLNYEMNWGPREGPKGPKQKDFWKGDER